MATAGTVVLEAKIAVDIVLAEDGKYYVDSATTMDGVIVRGWTEGPCETEAKARDRVKWQNSIPMFDPSDGSPQARKLSNQSMFTQLQRKWGSVQFPPGGGSRRP